MWANFTRVDFLGRDSSFEREGKVRRHLFTFSINREIRHFHVVVVQWRQRNVQKSVMHVQSCCFAHQTYRVFSLTWSASMQIYWNKRKRLHKKRVQLPQDWFRTPTWPSFHCFGTPIWPPWRHVKTLYCFFFLPFSLPSPSSLLSSLLSLLPRLHQTGFWPPANKSNRDEQTIKKVIKCAFRWLTIENQSNYF